MPRSSSATSSPKVRVALDWTLDLCFAKDFACVTDGPPARERVAAVHGLRVGAR